MGELVELSAIRNIITGVALNLCLSAPCESLVPFPIECAIRLRMHNEFQSYKYYLPLFSPEPFESPSSVNSDPTVRHLNLGLFQKTIS